jgi:hypothetical protein
MNSLPYPPGAARAIAQARSGGLKPADTVLIVLAGRHDCSNPQVFANPDRAYRWDWLRGLSVAILVATNTRIGNILSQIDQAAPDQIDVIDFERGKGWMVLFTKPRLKTVRWPAHQVADWLGPGTWHAELKATKDRAQALAAAKHTQPTFEQEPIWS